MFCSQCGAPMGDNDKFCGVCGAPNAGAAGPAPQGQPQPQQFVPQPPITGINNTSTDTTQISAGKNAIWHTR